MYLNGLDRAYLASSLTFACGGGGYSVTSFQVVAAVVRALPCYPGVWHLPEPPDQLKAKGSSGGRAGGRYVWGNFQSSGGIESAAGGNRQ